ncbi:MAG: EamA family transporter [Anaerolineales bacterium]|nr:DMT family transporter [Anaerolineae bacterium]PWB69417.1 MAG: EamA family transporter [Anaerolineales bacterium]
MLPIFYGLISSASWGAADFIGGLATKKSTSIRVLYLAEIAGFIPFLVLAILTREPIPAVKDLLMGAFASLIGLGGLVFLYRALAEGSMTITAPVSALFAALIPVVFGLFTLGIPSLATLIGFGLAFLAVWLISQTDSTNWRFSLSDLRLPLISGFFFGFYFIVIYQATLNSFFWTLTAARFAGFVALGLFALITRQSPMPPRETWTLCILNGVIDIAGNGFYVLSAQAGRIDVAAVLGALYPASTVLLAWIFLKERISLVQTLGIICAFIAIVLFTV